MSTREQNSLPPGQPDPPHRRNRPFPRVSAPRRTILSLAALTLGAALLTPPLRAFINEAISYALEAATPYVEEGFEVREDNWYGEVEPGQPLLVKHQLFRGNEYWFWSGTSWPGATVKVDAFNSKGESVGLESFSKNGRAGVRVLPKRTGVYFIRIIADYDPKSKEAKAAMKDPDLDASFKKAPKSLDWGLVYGYR